MTMEILELDLGRFSEKIYRPYLKLNDDGTYDYDGTLPFSNMGLTSFAEIPIRFRNVSGNFWCDQNQLTSLQYGPSYVGLNFSCFRNKLISLQYAPSYVGGNFWFNGNQLLSKVHKLKIGNEFKFDFNPLFVTDEVIEAVSKMTLEQQIKELHFFDEYDLEASKMLQKILDDLNVDYGTHRKAAKNFIKENGLKYLIG